MIFFFRLKKYMKRKVSALGIVEKYVKAFFHLRELSIKMIQKIRAS